MYRPTDLRLRDALESPKRGLRLFAAESHLALEEACEELARADPQSLAARWRVVEAALRDHLDAEDELMIPAYQVAEPEEADELRTEHARIRELLVELELEVRNHVLAPKRLQRLLEVLRAHARREDVSMYPWAERNLPLVIRRQLLARIAGWLRRHRK